MWESCRTMPLVGGFSQGSPVSPVLVFRRCSILTSLHPHRLSRPRCLDPPKSLHSTLPWSTDCMLLLIHSVRQQCGPVGEREVQRIVLMNESIHGGNIVRSSWCSEKSDKLASAVACRSDFTGFCVAKSVKKPPIEYARQSAARSTGNVSQQAVANQRRGPLPRASRSESENKHARTKIIITPFRLCMTRRERWKAGEVDARCGNVAPGRAAPGGGLANQREQPNRVAQGDWMVPRFPFVLCGASPPPPPSTDLCWRGLGILQLCSAIGVIRRTSILVHIPVFRVPMVPYHFPRTRFDKQMNKIMCSRLAVVSTIHLLLAVGSFSTIVALLRVGIDRLVNVVWQFPSWFRVCVGLTLNDVFTSEPHSLTCVNTQPDAAQPPRPCRDTMQIFVFYLS
ncbi:hypothetical protein PR048_021436 [Dryococelus australis]|uniref:Uncharacterized protein n=1 Tax=Dryococelus australis TaxID=614101 RepID=A0ABQ9GY66_9NEOP|nr:hypothetical protein PR048_021436 [Dryococelus australis]